MKIFTKKIFLKSLWEKRLPISIAVSALVCYKGVGRDNFDSFPVGGHSDGQLLKFSVFHLSAEEYFKCKMKSLLLVS